MSVSVVRFLEVPMVRHRSMTSSSVTVMCLCVDSIFRTVVLAEVNGCCGTVDSANRAPHENGLSMTQVLQIQTKVAELAHV